VDSNLQMQINENHLDKKLLQHYENSAVEEPRSDPSKPLEILESAGAIFKEEALKSIDEISQFHRQLYQNRSEFLANEIRRLKSAIRERNSKVLSLTDAKTKVLKTLDNSGAFEALAFLQSGLTEMVGELEGLKSKIDERKNFDKRKDTLTREISTNRTLLKNDLEDRRGLVDESVVLFARYTSHLYGKPAKLGIDVTTSGYRFNTTIDRDGSEGVEQMVIFCFDLMIATLRARRGSSFKTLIHDSSLYADVDPRQYGLALQLAKQESEAEGFQYICCLNSGALPREHLGEINMKLSTRLTLTDDSPATRLLGLSLSAREKS
jgi:uncharacterized protein YydD (DUF2326 family)